MAAPPAGAEPAGGDAPGGCAHVARDRRTTRTRCSSRW
jgi:hypothetical protein